MFIEFFFFLRRHGLQVSVHEWLTLLEALKLGLACESLLQFYHVCRAVCVKNEAHYDLFDQCFASYFKDAKAPESLTSDLLKWLEDPIFHRQLSAEERARLTALDLETLRKEFETRLKEQHERHDGGSHWVGTGGTSPFGNGGTHPSGVRVGGQSRSRSALQVAGERRFRNLRHDRTLDVRQLGVALLQLRELARVGQASELDLEASIAAIAKNAGEIDLVFKPERKNNLKLLLLMDVGGSMTDHSRLCENLFSAAHAARHFKTFEFYFFHNCIYETLATNFETGDVVSTEALLARLDASWMCLIVGDAAMNPAELTLPGGSIFYDHANALPGLEWLRRVRTRLPRTAWLNPEPERFWEITSNQMVRSVFEMFPLSLDGLARAIAWLKRPQAGSQSQKVPRGGNTHDFRR